MEHYLMVKNLFDPVWVLNKNIPSSLNVIIYIYTVYMTVEWFLANYLKQQPLVWYLLSYWAVNIYDLLLKKELFVFR